jgi:pimeloyl-ACP methyl ester carboxylesterase
MGDTAALRLYLAAINGPVVLVGHSYGGAVATDAATGDTNIKALVYLDAFAPDEGENVLALASATSVLANPDPTAVFTFVPAASPLTATTDLYIRPDFFPGAFANDIPPRRAAILAATGRPVTFGALTAPSTAPAWKTIPSWYEVGTIDRVIPAAQQLMMARRAHSHIVRLSTSHLPMESQPAAVDQLIESAARATT